MKKSYILIFLIIPAMLILSAAAMKYARGPYYICSPTDNDYLYLVSSLAMADSKPVFFTDHPGTPLQMLGAVTMKITHALDSSQRENLAYAVLKNPEFYLKAINIVLVSLNVLILFFIGLVTFNLTKNVGLGLLLQFSPFFSNITLGWGLNNVSCEPLLMFTSLLFVLILVKLLFSENIGKSAHRYTLVLAFISGFGIATKMTFAPMLIIPLIVLPKLRNKIGFILVTALSTILWTWPIHSQYERIVSFFYSILSRKSWYGHGAAGIDVSSMLYNILIMFKEFLHDPLFILFFATFIFIIIMFIRSSSSGKKDGHNLSFKILLAVIVSILLSLLIVIKQSAERYALPASCLTGFVIFLQLILLQKLGYLRRFNAQKMTFFIVVLLILSGVWRIYALKYPYQELLLIKNDALTYYAEADNEYKNYVKIFINQQPKSIAPSVMAGLSYGNNMVSHKYYHISEISEGGFSKGLYSETLQKIYGETYFYNMCSGEFYTWTKTFFIEDMITKGQASKIIFYGPPGFIKSSWLPCRTGSVLHLKNVSRGSYDNIYILEGISIKALNLEKFRFGCY
jgi:hypothetical protein